MVTRMYASLAGIVEGWSKNLASGVPLMLPPVGWLRRIAPWLMWLPSLVWIVPVVWLATGGPVALATVGISLLVWLEIYWQEKAPVGYALLFPFGALVVAFIMLRSAWRGRAKIVWEGPVDSARLVSGLKSRPRRPRPGTDRGTRPAAAPPASLSRPP